MKKILLIEDDTALRESTADFLKVAGFEVVTARDGVDGIQKSIVEFPDLIICDISMPILDGFEVYKALQQNYQTSIIPFIFLTAKVEREDIRSGMLLGADDYITKPFDLHELQLVINTRLQKQDKIAKISEERFDALVDNSPYSILIASENEQAVFVNQNFQQLFGYSHTELIDISVHTFLRGDNFQLKDKFSLCLRGLQRMQMEGFGIHKNGTEIPIRLFCNSNKIKGKTVLIINIIDKREMLSNASKTSNEDVSNAVHLLTENSELITKDLVDELLFIFGNKKNKKRNNEAKLSRRELEVLDLVCKGLSNNEIGDTLFISYRTVERHRTNIINKTNSKNIIEVVIYAIKNNLIEI